MSRRGPDPAAERAAKNQQTIKSLLKLEGNKNCADCKRNKHPRWASWNLGVFVCIRCSGIHRGMGTHISRVKSVDLDAWTDEQLQSVLRWGNNRANKYWEAKLAPGHTPSEAKIENFIRTKYDSKRWVMEGGLPDPSTLDDEGDEDIPLSVVQEKQKINQSSAARAVSTSSQPSQITRAPQVDLFGDDTGPVQRPATTEPAVRSAPPRGPDVPPKQTKPGDSLLGLDFFGSTSSTTSPPGRPASAANTNTSQAASSRPDLKQSILSLYASAPKSQPPSQPSNNSFSGAPTQQPQSSAFGGLNDAFSGLSFGAGPTSPTAQAKPSSPSKSSPFGNLGSFSQKSTPAAVQTSNASAGGDFFSSPPSSKPSKPVTHARNTSSGFGAFDSAPSASSTAAPASAGLSDMFDFSASDPAPAPAAAPAPPKPSNPPPLQASVFNLSSPQAPAKPTTTAAVPSASAGAGWGGAEAWGSNDVWSTPESNTSQPAAAPAAAAAAFPTTTTTTAPAATNDFGWGSSHDAGIGNGGFGSAATTTAQQPKISADEDFGGWNSAPSMPAASVPAPMAAQGAAQGGSGGTGGGAKAAGLGGASEDLFSNVWE